MTDTPRFLRWISVILLVLLAVGGCQTGPELRIAGEASSPDPIAEGKRLLEQGRAVEAVSAFRKRLRQDGSDLQVLNGLGIAYSELGRPDLAAEMFARALALAPDDPATLNNIGFSALRRAEAPLARHYLEKARRRNDGLEEIDGNLARLALLEAHDRRRPAARTLKQAAFHSEDSSVAVIRLARPNARARSSRPASAPEPKPLARPSATMIDFMSVTDPFSRRPSE